MSLPETWNSLSYANSTMYFQQKSLSNDINMVVRPLQKLDVVTEFGGGSQLWFTSLQRSSLNLDWNKKKAVINKI